MFAHSDAVIWTAVYLRLTCYDRFSGYIVHILLGDSWLVHLVKYKHLALQKNKKQYKLHAYLKRFFLLHDTTNFIYDFIQESWITENDNEMTKCSIINFHWRCQLSGVPLELSNKALYMCELYNTVRFSCKHSNAVGSSQMPIIHV